MMLPKKLWNPNGDASLEESLIGGNPTGMLNFNASRYKWADNLFKLMLDNTWFPEEANTAGEKKAYATLTPAEKRMYDLSFSQLSFNDSLQAENLIDNINQFVTNKIVNACLTRQAFEEVLHSRSYAVLLQDAVEDNSAIFNLYKEDLTLLAKNTVIAKNYNELVEGETTKEKFFYAMVANQILEGVYFLSGFAAIYYLGHKMKGSADMITFIFRDENTHLALFQNMIKTFIKENPDEPYFKYRATVNKMFDDAYKLEVSWFKYIAGGLISDKVIEDTIAYFVKKRMVAIGMYDEHTDLYGHGYKTVLVKQLESYGTFNDTKTNFFEGNVKNYSKQSLNFDPDMDFNIDVNAYHDPIIKRQQTYEEAVRAKEKALH